MVLKSLSLQQGQPLCFWPIEGAGNLPSTCDENILSAGVAVGHHEFDWVPCHQRHRSAKQIDA